MADYVQAIIFNASVEEALTSTRHPEVKILT